MFELCQYNIFLLSKTVGALLKLHVFQFASQTFGWARFFPRIFLNALLLSFIHPFRSIINEMWKLRCFSYDWYDGSWKQTLKPRGRNALAEASVWWSTSNKKQQILEENVFASIPNNSILLFPLPTHILTSGKSIQIFQGIFIFYKSTAHWITFCF